MLKKLLKSPAVLCLAFLFVVGAEHVPKIAIVGAGIGGTSCAYFLKELFQNKVEITIYNQDPQIGGRLNLVTMGTESYEAGGAVIHPLNKYMVEFADLFKLGKRKSSSNNLGIYDGSSFLLEESDWFVINMAKFLWRYGFSLVELWKEVKWMLQEFSRIYHLQDSGYSFTTVNGMLEYMNKNFRNMTQISLENHLEKHRYSKMMLNELVQAVMMVNYGQTNNISAFAGFVSLAGADNYLWSVEGGNVLVPTKLLEASGAKFTVAEVLKITLLSDNKQYSVKHKDVDSKEISEEIYDMVVLATPLIKGQNNIEFANFKKDMTQYQMNFHRTVATFIEGSLNPEAFGKRKVPDEIVYCKPNLIFNSIGKVSPVILRGPKKKSSVYKTFSSQILTQDNMNHFFKHIKMVKARDWLAYPHYDPPENSPPFMLYPGLYYINAIETAASAMEMSAIGAKNVALLTFNLWNNLVEKVDHFQRVYKNKDEL